MEFEISKMEFDVYKRVFLSFWVPKRIFNIIQIPIYVMKIPKSGAGIQGYSKLISGTPKPVLSTPKPVLSTPKPVLRNAGEKLTWLYPGVWELEFGITTNLNWVGDLKELSLRPQ
jgi:hypothetical protein